MSPIPSPTSNRIPLPDLHHQQIHPGGAAAQFGHPAAADHDDFFDQMLSALPTAWSDLGNPKSPWDLGGDEQKLFSIGTGEKEPEEVEYPPFDESSLLASRLRQHQISGGDKPIGIQLNHPGQQHQQHQQQLLFSGMGRSPGASDLMLPLPLSLSADEIITRSQDEGREGMYYGAPVQQHFQSSQSYGGAPVGPPPAAGGGGAAPPPPPRQRVRARRGQATDPHSIAERLRRERIAERMKALQELVPNANKTDKASMLDEIIDYVKFLQLQVKVLSMSRLGGAGAVAPLVADISSESGRGGNAAAAAGSDSLAVTEHQVAKLMEEDMGTAMQYLQGKGLCLMPISLASAISTAGCTARNTGGVAAALSGLLGGANPGLMLAPPANNNAGAGGDGPTSPSMSVLTVQSAMANGGDASSAVKEVGSVSKP